MDAAIQAQFPVELWSQRLDALYTSAADMHYSCKPDAAAERQYNRTLKLDPMATDAPHDHRCVAVGSPHTRL